ncbi:MAG TPA: 30S ribosomal protein S14 [Dehalococcoidia bacterium]|nr:30S ribosomal protein S14 [Dehalococcoidia bacterium]
MAKKSVVAREVKRQKLHDRHAAKRAELKKQRAEAVGNPDRLAEIQREFQKLPLNSSPSRLHNRCGVTGRPKGFMRKFGVSRIVFRELANQGYLPGIRKSSW